MLQCLWLCLAVPRQGEKATNSSLHQDGEAGDGAAVARRRSMEFKRLGKWGLSCDSCWNSRFLYNGSELKWREWRFFFPLSRVYGNALAICVFVYWTTASSCSSINFSEFTFYKKKKKIIYLLWTNTSSLERQHGAKLYWRYFTLRTSFVNWLCSRQSSCLRVTLCLVSSNILRKRSDLILVCGAETTLQNWRDFTAL